MKKLLFLLLGLLFISCNIDDECYECYEVLPIGDNIHTIEVLDRGWKAPYGSSLRFYSPSGWENVSHLQCAPKIGSPILWLDENDSNIIWVRGLKREQYMGNCNIDTWLVRIQPK